MCAFRYARIYDLFGSRDLDLDPMTLIYELDEADILKTYLHTKSEVSRSRLSNVKARTDGQKYTDARTRPTTLPRHIRDW